jgi:hypothetical protein
VVKSVDTVEECFEEALDYLSVSRVGQDLQ